MKDWALAWPGELALESFLYFSILGEFLQTLTRTHPLAIYVRRDSRFRKVVFDKLPLPSFQRLLGKNPGGLWNKLLGKIGREGYRSVAALQSILCARRSEGEIPMKTTSLLWVLLSDYKFPFQPDFICFFFF